MKTHTELWVVDHDSFEQGIVFTTYEKAASWIVEETGQIRDHDEFPDDEDWVEACEDWGWTILQSRFHS